MARQTDHVTNYAKAVVAGKIIAGKPVRQACQRHLNDLQRTDLVWRLDKANQIINFYPDLLTLEDGRPFYLEPFQKFIVGSLFGWYTPFGQRRFRTAYIETAKGTGKTPLVAGLGLFGLVADDEAAGGAAEIYSAATSREQATYVWKDAARMVEMSEDLKELIQVQVGSLSIPMDHSIFRPLSAEKRGLDGKRVHIALIDELHEHRSAIVVDKIRAGTKSRQNALIVEITNSGYDRNSVCWHHHQQSLNVLDGTTKNDTWFAYVCALDEGDDWKDPKVWIKTNPGLGTILHKKYLEERVLEAIQMPSQENIVKRLNFCMWTEQSVRWLQMDMWDKGSEPVEMIPLHGRKCYGGLDLAKVNDLSALTLLFPPLEDGEKWQVLAWYWVPEDDIRIRSERDKVPYDEWARMKLIEKTPGPVTDFNWIHHKIVKLATIFDIDGIAYDRTFAGELVGNLLEEGIEMIECGQGFATMPAPTAELERMIKGNKLQHGGDPVLRFCAANAVVEQNAAGDIKPDKEKSTEKIDGIVALIMSIYTMQFKGASDGSVYASRGIRTV